jgi:hypothetical protein
VPLQGVVELLVEDLVAEVVRRGRRGEEERGEHGDESRREESARLGHAGIIGREAGDLRPPGGILTRSLSAVYKILEALGGLRPAYASA